MDTLRYTLVHISANIYTGVKCLLFLPRSVHVDMTINGCQLSRRRDGSLRIQSLVKFLTSSGHLSPHIGSCLTGSSWQQQQQRGYEPLPSSECVAVELISERSNVGVDDVDPLLVVFNVISDVSSNGTWTRSTFESTRCPHTAKHRHIPTPYVCRYTHQLLPSTLWILFTGQFLHSYLRLHPFRKHQTVGNRLK